MTKVAVEKLSLPCNDDAFDRGEVSEPITLADDRRSASFFAEFLRLTNIW